MKAILTIITSLLVSASAFANDFAAVLGFRSNSADAVSTSVSTSGKTSFGLGVVGIFDLSGPLQGRAGFIYNQRNFSASVSSTEVEYNMSYVDVPLTLMYRFADYAGAFAGPVVGLLASKECKSTVSNTCSSNPESMITGFQLGTSFKFAPQMGAELYYEVIPSTFWKDSFKDMKTVGVNLMFTFE